MMEPTQRYLEPGWFTRHVFNPIVRRLARWGVSYRGTRELAVVGRTSGQVRTTVVNLLDHDGQQFLVAPRGNTQWVRNLRAVGTGELHIGGKVEPFTATEVADDYKPAILRAYLKRWKFEVGVFFDGVGAKAPEAKLREIAPGYPIFRIEPAARRG